MDETRFIEEEIDLRQYVAILIKHWVWIAGLTIVAGLVAFVVSSFMPPTYQATTLVAGTRPRYQIQFDPRFRDLSDSFLQSQYLTYPTLATSDELFQQLAQKTDWSMRSLQGRLEAKAGGDPSLLVLTVTGKEAEEVAAVANTWAELFVSTANRLYGDQDKPEQFEQQQTQAAQALTQADADLAAFRAENGFGFSSSNSSSQIIIDNNERDFNNGFGLIGQRLQTKNNLLTDYEAELVRLHQLQREVELLSATTTPDTSPVVIAGLLSEMVNIGLVEDTQPYYQIILETVDPVAGLAAMTQALESRVTAVEAEIKVLQEEIPTLQTELSTKQNQLEKLTRQRDIAAETYEVISRKVQEAKLENASNKQEVQIASQATVPIEPVGPRRLLNTAVAGVLGLMVGVFGVFALEWWRDAEDVSRVEDKSVARQPEEQGYQRELGQATSSD